MAQQKLSQSMPMAQLIFLGGFAGSHQIAQRLMVRIRNPDRRQFAGAVTARQLLGVPAVGLHPLSGLGGNQGRRDHLTCHTQLRELPIQHISGWAGLVAALQPFGPTQFRDHLSHRLQTIGDDAEAADLAGRLGNRHRDRICVDIQSDKAYFTHERPFPFVCGSAPLDSSDSQRNPRHRETDGRSILTEAYRYNAEPAV